MKLVDVGGLRFHDIIECLVVSRSGWLLCELWSYVEEAVEEVEAVQNDGRVERIEKPSIRRRTK